MSNLEKLKKSQSNRNLSSKIAEIIWMSLGGLVLLSGVVCLILNIVINNIGTDTTNMYSHPLFFLVEWQDAFVVWFNEWTKLSITSFGSLGLWLVICSVIYLLIVFAVYASKQDALEKKAKAKKLREKNARKFLEEQQLNEEKLKQEQATTEAVTE
jgi:high-affinity K+ transport system ATPase subunit B